MISKLLTPDIANNKAVLDIGEWQSLTIQIIGLTGTASIQGTNDGGEITGSVNSSAATAANFTAIQAVNLTTGVAATAVTGTTLFRIDPVCFKYLQLGDGSTFAATKIIIQATQPY